MDVRYLSVTRAASTPGQNLSFEGCKGGAITGTDSAVLPAVTTAVVIDLEAQELIAVNLKGAFLSLTGALRANRFEGTQEDQLLSTIRINSASLSGVNGLGKHSWKPVFNMRLPSACVTNAVMAITGTLPPESGPRARIARSRSNPFIPGICMSDTTNSDDDPLLPEGLQTHCSPK
jgi:hypothetical protein